MKYVLSILLLPIIINAAAVKCSDLSIPDLKGMFKSAKLCCGGDGVKALPLTVYMHGDMGGGVAEFAYDKIIHKIAANGFCVVAPRSCPSDYFC